MQYGLAAPTPRPTMATSTRATLCCSCSLTHSSRPPFLRTSLTWTSSWWLCLVASLLTFSPSRSKIGLNLNPIFWLTIPDATSGFEARPRLGSWPTASHFACGSPEGSPQPERPWLTRCGGVRSSRARGVRLRPRGHRRAQFLFVLN